MIKINEVSLNVDSLTGQKVDPKVTGIIFAELCILNKIELMSDKTSPLLIEKIYLLNQKRHNASKDGSKAHSGN